MAEDQPDLGIVKGFEHFFQQNELQKPRRSSILKQLDPNKILSQENKDEKRSSRRVSFASTYQCKELLPDGTTIIMEQQMAYDHLKLNASTLLSKLDSSVILEKSSSDIEVEDSSFFESNRTESIKSSQDMDVTMLSMSTPSISDSESEQESAQESELNVTKNQSIEDDLDFESELELTLEPDLEIGKETVEESNVQNTIEEDIKMLSSESPLKDMSIEKTENVDSKIIEKDNSTIYFSNADISTIKSQDKDRSKSFSTSTSTFQNLPLLSLPVEKAHSNIPAKPKLPWISQNKLASNPSRFSIKLNSYHPMPRLTQIIKRKGDDLSAKPVKAFKYNNWNVDDNENSTQENLSNQCNDEAKTSIEPSNENKENVQIEEHQSNISVDMSLENLCSENDLTITNEDTVSNKSPKAFTSKMSIENKSEMEHIPDAYSPETIKNVPEEKYVSSMSFEKSNTSDSEDFDQTSTRAGNETGVTISFLGCDTSSSFEDDSLYDACRESLSFESAYKDISRQSFVVPEDTLLIFANEVENKIEQIQIPDLNITLARLSDISMKVEKENLKKYDCFIYDLNEDHAIFGFMLGTLLLTIKFETNASDDQVKMITDIKITEKYNIEFQKHDSVLQLNEDHDLFFHVANNLIRLSFIDMKSSLLKKYNMFVEYEQILEEFAQVVKRAKGLLNELRLISAFNNCILLKKENDIYEFAFQVSGLRRNIYVILPIDTKLYPYSIIKPKFGIHAEDRHLYCLKTLEAAMQKIKPGNIHYLKNLLDGVKICIKFSGKLLKDRSKKKAK